MSNYLDIKTRPVESILEKLNGNDLPPLQTPMKKANRGGLGRHDTSLTRILERLHPSHGARTAGR